LAATITGTVYDAGTGLAIAGAAVSANSSSGVEIGNTTTNESGTYELTDDSISTGDITLSFAADGYVEASGNFTVMAGDITYLESVYLSPTSSEPGAISGTIIDATTQDTVIPNVVLNLIPGINQAGGTTPLVTITSETNGTFLISDVEPGTYTLIAEKDGYTDAPIMVNSVGGETKSYEHSMSPVVAQGEIRIILSWGETPLDLDSHLYTPEIEGTAYHVNWTDMGSLTAAPYVNLDRDDVESYGPETITIKQSFEDVYSYKVHNYSGTPSMTRSGAVVKVFDETGLLVTVNIPAVLPGDGLWWDVLRYDGATGRLTTPDGISLTGSGNIASIGLSDKDDYACFISAAGAL
jgi:hypothetical protein